MSIKRILLTCALAAVLVTGCEDTDDKREPVPGGPGQPVPQPRVDFAPRTSGAMFA